jgi:hypothetical protein
MIHPAHPGSGEAIWLQWLRCLSGPQLKRCSSPAVVRTAVEPDRRADSLQFKRVWSDVLVPIRSGLMLLDRRASLPAFAGASP